MNGEGDLLTKDMGEAEEFDVLFVLVYTDSAYTQQLHFHVEKFEAWETTPQGRKIRES